MMNLNERCQALPVIRTQKVKWTDSKKDNNVITPSYPIYSKEIKSWIKSFDSSELADTDHVSNIKEIKTKPISELTRDETLARITHIVRGEHFCDGSIARALESGELEELLGCIGTVIELPEKELGMGSELVSCMPGFIASIFDVICTSAKKHTAIPDGQIVKMVLNTLNAASELMLEKEMSFGDVVTRVATKGGITEEGTKVVYEMFPETADKLFENTLEKRRLTAVNAQKSFAE